MIQRAEISDGFFVVPLAAGGLDYAAAAEATSNHLTAQNLSHWNMEKIAAASLGPEHAAAIADRVLAQRLQAIHRHLPPGDPLRMGLFVRRSPPLEPGTALCLDWNSHFIEKEATAVTWERLLLPALASVATAIRKHAPGREVVTSGLPTLPAALALGCTFLAPGGIAMAWEQVTPGRPAQQWSLAQPRETSGFAHRLVSQDPAARDIAVLVSVTDNIEPLFAATRKALPPVRAFAHVSKAGAYPHIIGSPGKAADIAYIVQDALRTARREYGNVGTVHLFVAVPAGIAAMIGQLLNTFGTIQTYEHVGSDGSGAYRPAALLRPSS